MIKKLLHIFWWAMIGILLLVSFYFIFMIFIWHMEFRHDLIAIAISIKENPENFQNINFHLTPAKEFIDEMLVHHQEFGHIIWYSIGLLLLISVFLFISVILQTKIKNGASK